METQSNSGYSVEQPVRESWRDVAENLYADMTQLYRREGELIRAEINDKISDIKTSFVSMAIGASLLFVGVFAVTATAIIALDIVLPLWAAALIVSAVYLIVGGVMCMAAKKKLATDNLKPTESLDTLSEIRSTFKERINEFKSHHH